MSCLSVTCSDDDDADGTGQLEHAAENAVARLADAQISEGDLLRRDDSRVARQPPGRKQRIGLVRRFDEPYVRQQRRNAGGIAVSACHSTSTLNASLTFTAVGRVIGAARRGPGRYCTLALTCGGTRGGDVFGCLAHPAVITVAKPTAISAPQCNRWRNVKRGCMTPPASAEARDSESTLPAQRALRTLIEATNARARRSGVHTREHHRGWS
jgi:hypothetical protein